MRHPWHKSLPLLLALLVAASSWTPLPGRAEAQMRCAGASPQSAPCARAELPAAGLPPSQVYGILMSCCRVARGGCAHMPDCPMQRHTQAALPLPGSRLSAPRCVVSVRVSAPVATTAAVRRARWLLSAVPAQAPPASLSAFTVSLPLASNALWTYSPVLPPPAAPRFHGLRAPPAA